MKNNLKRIFCLILVLTMVFSLGMPAFATDELEGNGCTGSSDCSAESHNEGCQSLNKEAPPAHTHAYTEAVTKEPSCFAEGVKTFTCSAEGCDKPSYTEAIPATGAHRFAEGKCLTEGCPATHEHNYVEKIITPATCTVDGEKQLVCSVEGCDKPLIKSAIVAPGHSYGENNICTVEGCGFAKPTDCDGSAECPAADDGHDYSCLKALALRAEQEAAAEMEKAKQAAIQKVQEKLDALTASSTAEERAAVEAEISYLVAHYPDFDPNTHLDLTNLQLQSNIPTDPLDSTVYVAQIGEARKYETLAAAIADASPGETITLLSDVIIETTAGENYALLIKKALTIDGVDGKKITYNKDDYNRRAINIETDGAVTFKNLTIDTDGAERGINIINLPATVILTDVNITAANYAVMIATTAADDSKGASLTITGGSFSGLNAINIAAPKSNVIISGAALTTTDNNDYEADSTVALYSTANGSTVSISETSFNYVGDHANGGFLIGDSSQNSKITPTDITIAPGSIITDTSPMLFEAMIGDACYTTLEDAVADANEKGGTVTLIRDKTASSPVVLQNNAALDLNGKSFQGDIMGLLKVNKGTYKTSNGATLVAPANAKFISEDAIIKVISPGELSVEAGSVTLGENWRTLPGQKITVASGASFTVPSGKSFEILGQADVKGTLTVSGNLILGREQSATDDITDEEIKAASLGATLTSANSNLNVYSGITGYIVIYSNGAYKLVEAEAKISKPNSSPIYHLSLYNAVKDIAEDGDTVTMLKNSALADNINLGSSITLDMANHSLSIASGKTISIASGKTLSIVNAPDTVTKAGLEALLPGYCVVPGTASGSFIIKAHSYIYTASGNVITESCANGCGHKATATLNANASYFWTGAEIKPVTVTYSSNWAGSGDYKPGNDKIIHANNKDVGAKASGSLTIGGAIAKKSFEIVKKSYTMKPLSRYIKGSGNSLSFVTDIVAGEDILDTKTSVTPLTIYRNGSLVMSLSSGYTVKANSDGYLVITLSPSVMNKLTRTGWYELSADFLYGTAEAAFRVILPLITPTTGDPANFLLWGGLLLGATAAMGGILIVLKKKGKKQ